MSTSELLYWTLLSAVFIIPCVLAVVIMLLSKKMGHSFLWSLAANIVITVIASLWWYNVSAEPVNYIMGRIVFLIIALVSTEIFILFILFALRNSHGFRPTDRS